MKRKLIRFIDRHRILERFFSRFAWYRTMVIREARKMLWEDM